MNKQHKQCSIYACLVAGTVVAFVFQVVGFTTKTWLVVDESSEHRSGTWYRFYGLFRGDSVVFDIPVSHSMYDDELVKASIREAFVAPRILACISFSLSCATLVLVVVTFPPHTVLKIVAKVIAVCFAILSGATAIASVVQMHVESKDIINEAVRHDPGAEERYKFPYSLVWFGLGGGLFFIVALVLVIDTVVKGLPQTESHVTTRAQLHINHHGTIAVPSMPESAYHNSGLVYTTQQHQPVQYMVQAKPIPQKTQLYTYSVPDPQQINHSSKHFIAI